MTPSARPSLPARFVAHLSARTPLGWLQLRHNKARLVSAIAGVAFENILTLMQLGFLGALQQTSVMSHKGWNADVVLMAADADHLDDIGSIPRRRLYQALAVDGVKEASPVQIGELAWTDPATQERTRVRVFGVDPDKAVFTDPLLQAQLSALKLPDTALFDRLARGNFRDLVARVSAGEPVAYEAAGRRFTVEGLFRQGASFSTDGTIVVSDQTFARFFPTRSSAVPNLVFIKFEAGRDPEAMAQRLSEVLPSSDTRAVTLTRMVDEELHYQSSKRPIGFVFSFGIVIGVIVGIVIVYQVLTTDVQDHLAEYATLKAMGYAQRWFLAVVFEEALILAALGFIPGFVIALGLYQIAAAGTGLPIAMTVLRAAGVLGSTILMCAVSGAVATRRLAKADPADLF